MYGLTLVLILAIVGGLIAYIGDKIGMKVGRKRLTLFGLRPKHTSILITIVTGIFIAASSITVLSIVSQDVRTALFEMKAIQEALTVSQLQLEESTSRYEQMERSLESVVEERDKAAQELDAAQADMEVVLSEYNQVVDDLEMARNELEVKRERVDEFREMIERLEVRRAELEEGIEYLLNEYKYLADQYVILEDQMRGGNLVFRADEIIYDQVFEAGKPLGEVSDALVEFLREADKVALRRGARTEEDGDSALKLQQDVFDFAAHTLHLQDGYYVVRAISKSNTLLNEPVVTYLELIPNDILFLENTVLVESVIDTGSDVDKQILNLIGEANQLAIREGMITQEGAAVEVALESFLNAIQRAREHKGEVEIQGIVMEDTWAAFGPIKLELKVNPL